MANTRTKAKISRLTYITVFAASGTVVLAALYFFIGRPAFKYSDDMRRRFVSFQDRLQKAEELVRSVPNPQKALQAIERKSDEFTETSGPGRQLSRIIQELGQSAADRNITVVSITPKEDLKTGEASLPSGVRKRFFEMVLNAPYQQITEYSRVLSGLPGAFTIETLTVERQNGDPSQQEAKTGMLKAVFIVSTCIVEGS